MQCIRPNLFTCLFLQTFESSTPLDTLDRSRKFCRLGFSSFFLRVDTTSKQLLFFFLGRVSSTQSILFWVGSFSTLINTLVAHLALSLLGLGPIILANTIFLSLEQKRHVFYPNLRVLDLHILFQDSKCSSKIPVIRP